MASSRYCHEAGASCSGEATSAAQRHDRLRCCRRPLAQAGLDVGHHPLDFHPQARVVGDRGLKDGHGAALPLVLHHPAEGDPGSNVDADVNVLLSRKAVRLPVSQSRRYRLPLQTLAYRVLDRVLTTIM